MKNRELRHCDYPIPSYSMQFSQYTCPVLGWKFDGFKLSPAISTHTNVKLVGVFVPPNDWRSTLEISTHIVRISHGQSVRIQSDNSIIGNAQNSLVTTAPRVLDDHVAGHILRLFRWGGRRGRRGGRSRWWVVGRSCWVATHEVHLWFREIVERMGLRRTRTQKEPYSTCRRWRQRSLPWLIGTQSSKSENPRVVKLCYRNQLAVEPIDPKTRSIPHMNSDDHTDNFSWINK